MDGTTRSGSCLCGGVAYTLHGELRGVINCFCAQCRKTSGHHVAATRTMWSDVEIISDETLRWYSSSAEAKRGFWSRCGGNVYWRPENSDKVSIMAGTIDPPTGLRTVENIFTEDMNDYHAKPALT